jgi:hypoxanthine phosphoribosyltransferase
MTSSILAELWRAPPSNCASAAPGDLWKCALLDKPQRREIWVAIGSVGFSIGDVFAVSYGTDYAEKYRHLHSIGAVE